MDDMQASSKSATSWGLNPYQWHNLSHSPNHKSDNSVPSWRVAEKTKGSKGREGEEAALLYTKKESRSVHVAYELVSLLEVLFCNFYTRHHILHGLKRRSTFLLLLVGASSTCTKKNLIRLLVFNNENDGR